MSTRFDTLHRFLIEGCGVRGEHVSLDSTWQTLLERGEYDDPARGLLGEALAATALLASTIRFDGSLILQASGNGPLRLLVVEASGERTLRGLAHTRIAAASGDAQDDLLGRGRLALTVDPGEGRDRYQGVVDFDGGELRAVLESYFARSEQIPTRLWLAADGRRAAGLMLQHLPGAAGNRTPSDFGDEIDADGWNRSVTLAETLSARELLALDAVSLLQRLYHQERVRVFEPERWGFRCRCSRDRVKTLLHGLGREETEDILAEQGAVSVTCEFCNARYRFDAVDVAELFSPIASPAPAREM